MLVLLFSSSWCNVFESRPELVFCFRDVPFLCVFLFFFYDPVLFCSFSGLILLRMCVSVLVEQDVQEGQS